GGTRGLCRRRRGRALHSSAPRALATPALRRRILLRLWRHRRVLCRDQPRPVHPRRRALPGHALLGLPRLLHPAPCRRHGLPSRTPFPSLTVRRATGAQPHRSRRPLPPYDRGNFEMSHQQALAQVTAQAVHSQYTVGSQADYSLPFSSATTSALTSQFINSSANVTSMKETATLPLHTVNDNLKSNEVSQGFQTSALTVDKPADDGYNWRKYGQKAVKGGEYPRSYYKCTQASCPVKKKVEHSAYGQITQIIYRGQHNHQRPPKRRSKDGGNLLNEDDFPENRDTLTRSEPGSQDHSGKVEVSNDGITGSSISKRRDGGDQSSGSSDREEDNDEAGDDNGDAGIVNANKRHVPAPAQRIIVQTTSEIDLLDDGYRWRKYGQKVVKGNPHPRSYYKCTYQGCDVKKHIERCSQDPTAVITTYEGKHSHDVPAARSSVAAAASANASSSISLLHRGQKAASSSQRVLPRAALHTSDSSLQLKEENEIT
uniref:WRKY domain-containing protein n=1 Tax=Aegilops tauschii subsp. strangulata TaxID=200361 RepID=A0A453I1M9_AEGTS